MFDIFKFIKNKIFSTYKTRKIKYDKFEAEKKKELDGGLVNNLRYLNGIGIVGKYGLKYLEQ